MPKTLKNINEAATPSEQLHSNDLTPFLKSVELGLQCPVTPDSLLLTHEVAVILRWHEESVRRALRQRRIRGIKIGRGWRVSVAAVERFKAEGCYE